MEVQNSHGWFGPFGLHPKSVHSGELSTGKGDALGQRLIGSGLGKRRPDFRDGRQAEAKGLYYGDEFPDAGVQKFTYAEKVGTEDVP